MILMKKFISIIILSIFMVFFASAHTGRTDIQGGHNDYNNESGLGSYHYHHGYEAHIHENGVCQYQVTAAAPAEPSEPEPTQTAPEQQPLLESVSEEDIGYSQFATLEETYESGYFYALYHKYSNLYEENENRSKLESLLNLGILTNLYFRNSKITYSDEVQVEGFTNEDAFIEGEVQGLADLENTLFEYENSDFYKDNGIYKAGADEFDTSGIEQAAYQEGYKKGLNDFTEIEPSNNKSDALTIIDLSLY